MRGASAKPSVCSVTLWGSTAVTRSSALQPGSRGAGDRAQALLHERAVLAHERHEVGDRRERDEVELRLQLGGVAPGRPVERLRELVRDAGRAQLGRVATDRRVHDRAGGQRVAPGGGGRSPPCPSPARARASTSAQAVMPQSVVISSRAPGAMQLLDALDRQAVALVAAGQPHVHGGAERLQRACEHGRGADAVDVVVAVDRDRRCRAATWRMTTATASAMPANRSGSCCSAPSRKLRAAEPSANPRRTSTAAVVWLTPELGGKRDRPLVRVRLSAPAGLRLSGHPPRLGARSGRISLKRQTAVSRRSPAETPQGFRSPTGNAGLTVQAYASAKRGARRCGRPRTSRRRGRAALREWPGAPS